MGREIAGHFENIDKSFKLMKIPRAQFLGILIGINMLRDWKKIPNS